jgi:hypothetical protein
MANDNENSVDMEIRHYQALKAEQPAAKFSMMWHNAKKT